MNNKRKPLGRKKYERRCKANFSMHIPDEFKKKLQDKVKEKYDNKRSLSFVILRQMYIWYNNN